MADNGWKRRFAREWLWLVGSIVVATALALGITAATLPRYISRSADFGLSSYDAASEPSRLSQVLDAGLPNGFGYGIQLYAFLGLGRLTVWSVRTAKR